MRITNKSLGLSRTAALASVIVSKMSAKRAPRGEVMCLVNGEVTRREYSGVSTWNTAKEDFANFLCAECPFLRAFQRDELHAVSLTYNML